MSEQLIQTPGVFGENGNFLLERTLGEGGMGGVYLGRDKMLDRPVAVKVMLKKYGSDPEFVERFKREAQAAAKLLHPNIAQIYSYGISDSMPYIAMELVSGGSLYQLMSNAPGKTDITRVMKLGEQVAQALRCAADQGLVHGDVKPENILLDHNGNAKLVDFGLAGMQKDTDEIWGTPYYIAPEKVRRQTVDYRADMYSLGGTLYHALTGVAPFEGADASEVVKARFAGAPRKPSEVRPGISPQIDYLLMRMLALDPAERYPTVEALCEDMRKVMTIGVGTTQRLSGEADKSAPSKKIKLSIHRNTTPKPGRSAEAEDGEPAARGSGSGLRIKAKKSGFKMKPVAVEGVSESEPEEKDNAGAKFGLTIGGVIAAIGLTVGGLVWYQVADRNARAAELAASIRRGISAARDSLTATRTAALKFADTFDSFANEAVADCQKPTDDLAELFRKHDYPGSVIAMLKPAPSKELLEAIASTNVAAAAEGEAKDEAKAGDAAASAAETPASVAAVVQPREETFPPPTDDEADPMSPEHDKYLERKAAWEAEHKRNKSAAAPVAAEAAKTVTVATAEGTTEKVPAVVADMAELWDRAYQCQACAIRIRHAVAALVDDIDAALKVAGEDEPSMRKLETSANAMKERYETIRTGKDVETVEKAKSVIRNKGKKSVKNEVNRIRREEGEREREEAKRRREQAERERLAKLEAEHRELVANEVSMAKEQYAKTIRNLELLDWDGAIRQIKFTQSEFKTSEGNIEAEKQIFKVEAMQSVQAILRRNLKGFTFKRGKLAGATVVEADDGDIVYSVRDNPRKQVKLPWRTFYANSEYSTNMSELLNRFVVFGDRNGTPKLNKGDQAKAMFGAALSMKIICGSEPTAADFSVLLVREMIKKFPQKMFIDRAKEAFPDVDFSDVESAAAAEDL